MSCLAALVGVVRRSSGLLSLLLSLFLLPGALLVAFLIALLAVAAGGGSFWASLLA